MTRQLVELVVVREEILRHAVIVSSAGLVLPIPNQEAVVGLSEHRVLDLGYVSHN
ncbi:MAG: hypothetical protein AAB410_03160 [Patescibacteria group bacterium]